MPIIWYFWSTSEADNTLVHYESLAFIFGFGVLELIAYIGGRYYMNKLYGADFKQLLLEDDNDDEEESEEESEEETISGSTLKMDVTET